MDSNNDTKLIIIVKGRIGVYRKDGKMIDTLEFGRMYSDYIICNMESLEFIPICDIDCLILKKSDFIRFLDVIKFFTNRKLKTEIIKKR